MGPIATVLQRIRTVPLSAMSPIRTDSVSTHPTRCTVPSHSTRHHHPIRTRSRLNSSSTALCLNLSSPSGLMTMEIQLIMKCGGLEYDLESVDFHIFPYVTLKELVTKLHKVVNATKAVKLKDAILYHTFDSSSDRYSGDFARLLSIRYREEAHPLRNFLLQLSPPALLEVCHDFTIKRLQDNKSSLEAFAQYAETNAKLKQPFIDRAKKVLAGGPRTSLECDILAYQGDILPRPHSVLSIANTALGSRKTVITQRSQVDNRSR